MLRSPITAPPGGGRESRAESSTQGARPAPDASIRRRLRVAHLVYTEDALPGLRRCRCGRGFSYRGPDGKRLPPGEHRSWIESLAIPPAWSRVWICPLQNGHLQATGYDDRGRHLLLAGARVQLAYRGKSGCKRMVQLTDGRLARVLAGIKNLPGQRLFQWLDEAGAAHPIDATDVNDYLREIAGADITAKEFRTWHGSVAALAAILEEDAPENPKQRQRHAIRVAASHLGNTQATARKYYVHPKVLELAESPKQIEQLRTTPDLRRELKQNEARLLSVLSTEY